MTAHLHVAPGPLVVDPDEQRASAPIRVVLVDEHLPLRRSLRLLLDGEDEFEVVTETRDHAELARQLDGEQPEVLVLDLGLHNGLSVEKIRSLSERAPHTKIVILTMEDNPVFAQRTLTAGASGFVSKDLADIELPEAIRAAARGDEFVSPRVAARLDALHRTLTDNQLTRREVEVLRLIAFGHTSVEVARMLHLSPRTIETHRAHVQSKLGLATRAELVRYALRRGLIGA